MTYSEKLQQIYSNLGDCFIDIGRLGEIATAQEMHHIGTIRMLLSEAGKSMEELKGCLTMERAAVEIDKYIHDDI